MSSWQSQSVDNFSTWVYIWNIVFGRVLVLRVYRIWLSWRNLRSTWCGRWSPAVLAHKSFGCGNIFLQKLAEVSGYTVLFSCETHRSFRYARGNRCLRVNTPGTVTFVHTSLAIFHIVSSCSCLFALKPKRTTVNASYLLRLIPLYSYLHRHFSRQTTWIC